MADEQIVEDKPVTEEDLRDLKYGKDGVEDESPVEPTDTEEVVEDESDITEGDDNDQIADDTEETPPTFTKQFENIQGDTPEEYARNLEVAYQNSTAEAIRLKQLNDDKQAQGAAEVAQVADPATEEETATPVDPVSLFMKQKMDEEINTAYTDFSKTYPRVTDPTDYQNFTRTVAQLSRTILDSEKRLAPPKELYSKAAIILGWNADTKSEDLGMAVKGNAASSKTNSAVKPTPKSKITEAQMALNRKMYPGKSDADIRAELEPYIT